MNSIETISREVAGALINGAWQGLALAGVAWLTIRFTPRLNAATRHAICLVTLLVMAALPVAHFVAGTRTQEGKPAVAAPAPVADVRKDVVPPTPVEGPERGVVVFPSIPAASMTDEIAEEPGQRTYLPEETPRDERSSDATRFAIKLPGWAWIALAGGWAVIALGRCARLGCEMLLVLRLKRRGKPADHDMCELFRELTVETRTPRDPALMVSATAPAPMVLGFGRPVICLPADFVSASSREQREQVLRHELAHVARRDDWANLAQQLAASALFFHPASWWLMNRLKTDREIACDDHVVQRLKNRREYALFLTEFAERMRGREYLAAPAAWSNKSELKERIGMLLDTKRDASPKRAPVRVGLFSGAALALAVAGLNLAPRLAMADSTAAASPVVSEPAEIRAGSSVIAAAPATLSAPAAVTLTTSADVSSEEASEAPRGPKKRASDTGESIDTEKRLARLERLVEQLLDRQARPRDGKGPEIGHRFEFKAGDEKWGELARGHAKLAQNHKELLNEKEMARIHEEVQRSVERAHQEMARAMKESKTVQKEHAKAQAQHGAEAKRKALEARRSALERQISELERQIEKLETEDAESVGSAIPEPPPAPAAPAGPVEGSSAKQKF